MKLDVEEIAVFGAVSESFTKKNTNCSIVKFYYLFLKYYYLKSYFFPL